ncbi:MAG: LutB/LldF family L-lactate oxidation iron-sulfur protein [Armatimonadota bacterium]|nr:LutB/LldF family L-lactate oxidation iron-sulfur protein [Armatimonadota bacterium]MDR7403664.1 LutB/LldF family L-lactate oxidation iron-sulfur protein [Armatimonadota bacterium]
MRSVPIDFVRASEAALADPVLHASVRRAMVRFRDLQRAVIEEVPDWQALREHAHRVKMHTLAHLDRYLEQLDERVTAAGGRVHWARDAGEAQRIIADLVRARGGRAVVKSKSMTSEEIELNTALQAAGCQVVETDLGEYLVQLAGDRPAHLIAPAIHRSTEEIARLLADRLGVPVHDDPAELTRTVRRVLRRTFLSADVGITGVNFAVAETGTLVIVENEGNARLTTTLPRMHIALMGVEKVIPRLADLAVFLTLLPRAATGQRLSSYVSWITGPRRPGEGDGPEELHLVILDNGRSGIAADPVMAEALACIRCGACLDVCPVFERTAGHAYGSVYSGPIGAVITPLLRGLDAAAQLPFASSLCGACGEICPVRIDLPRLLLELRARVVSRGWSGPMERMFVRGWTAVMARASRLRVAGRMARWALRALQGRRVLPYPLSAWVRYRDLPAPPADAFRDRWQKIRSSGGAQP